EHAVPGYRFPRPDGRADLRRMPGSDVPVIRQPFVEGDLLPFWSHAMPVDDHHLYRSDDPACAENLIGTRAETEALELLRHALTEVAAPEEQFLRLGLR
ncbi:MAG: sulfatase, partial [Ilumatobacter sp.]